MSSDLEERLAALEARVGIMELTARYCWHVARGEGQALADLFTDDGALDGTEAGMERIEGRAALVAFYAKVSTPLSAFPFIHNHIIEVTGPDTATGSCVLDAIFTRGDSAYRQTGHYLDTYRRVDDQWRFVERKLFFNPRSA